MFTRFQHTALRCSLRIPLLCLLLAGALPGYAGEISDGWQYNAVGQSCEQKVNRLCEPLLGDQAVMGCAWMQLDRVPAECREFVNDVFDLRVAAMGLMRKGCQGNHWIQCFGSRPDRPAVCDRYKPSDLEICMKEQQKFSERQKTFLRKYAH